MIELYKDRKRFCTYCKYNTFRLPPKPHICSGCGKEYVKNIPKKNGVCGKEYVKNIPKKKGLDSWI